jgi:KAP-like P-loop domain-containing protein
VVEAVADILSDRLRDAAADDAVRRSNPVLIHVDGPGRTLFLNKVEANLELGHEWTVIRFDAWQHQRVPPPWWWLIRAIDSELRSYSLRWSQRFDQRIRDWRWRGRLLVKDLGIVLPAILVAGLIAVLAWMLSGKTAVVDIVQWAATALAAVTAVLGVAWSAANALRRHLLMESPAGATAVLKISDPMAELRRRYEFLIRSAGTPVAILIDNLDRCRAEYVVELLEGIQTLLKQSHANGNGQPPMVVYLVAADRDWLCDSYLDVYREFQETAREPGRPFGLAFIEKIFNLSLRIPKVPAAVSLSAETSHALQDYLAHPLRFPGCDGINAAEYELDVRAAVRTAERGNAQDGRVDFPSYGLRLCAVRRLAELERHVESRMVADAEQALTELTEELEPGPIVARHLYAAYCVQRTLQLLAGHDVDDGPLAIKRLGVWTIITLRWPLLADDLERYPSHLAALRDGVAPDGVDEALAPVFRLPEAKALGELAESIQLDEDEVKRFTGPLCVRLERSS